MLFEIIFDKFFSFFAEIFLHCRIDRQLLTDGMTCKIPCEHVSPFYLVFRGAACFEFIVAMIEVLMVFAKSF